MLRGLSRRIKQDPAAWGAFRSAVQEQIPPETSDALGNLSEDNLEELANKHSTEGLLMAVLTGEEGTSSEMVEVLLGKWRDENKKAENQASKDAKSRELQEELDNLRQENEQLSFSSRIANERASALAEEVQVLTGERQEASSLVKNAERQAASVAGVRGQLEGRIAELERRSAHLERALEGERRAYASAAERVEGLHEELGKVSAERDRIRDALESAKFTDKGFGDLLVRSVKNEVSALPGNLDSAARTAQLLEFMSKVLSAHAELREPRPRGGGGRKTRNTQEEPEEPDPALAYPRAEPEDEFAGAAPSTNGVEAKPRPTLSFRALGGAGQVGGSSHLLDFGRTRVLVDAGIKPDGRGPVAPDFKAVENLDAAFITHAHLDHCGALPLLVRDRPDLPIYCTPPSARLIVSALNDHAAMGGGVSGGAPIHEVGKRLVPVPFGRPIDVGDTRVTLTESGHILGAASVLLRSGAATVFHTGDICMEDHFSIPSAQLPEVSDIDLLIMERRSPASSSSPSPSPSKRWSRS